MGGVDVTSVSLPSRVRRVDLVRVLLVVLAAIPYAVGRVAGAVAAVAVWVWAAVLVGWRDATGTPGGG